MASVVLVIALALIARDALAAGIAVCGVLGLAVWMLVQANG
ncbi:hypothetical protein [Tateyamaria sp. ANG-S1]|nr:hypothetical protein [Tateyamaria sp. ANG-S1]